MDIQVLHDAIAEQTSNLEKLNTQKNQLVEALKRTEASIYATSGAIEMLNSLIAKSGEDNA